ncbi:MAG: rod shape-determining protein [Planctomycetes bacterium]|nr:rod shape-determining protein [Planctomycetota bacterium]
MVVGVKDKNEVRTDAAPRVDRDLLKLGFDFGTNTSVIVYGGGGGDEKSELVYSVVGYAKPGLLPGILPKGKTVLYGEEALRNRRYLDLKWPMEKGIISNLAISKDFVTHLRSLVDPSGQRPIWGVVGCPANASTEDLSSLRQASAHAFAKILIVPEPFLAAMGLRDESRLSDNGYIDPTRNSLIVDIGAGTTDFCMVQGYYPGKDEQISVAHAGNDIDMALRSAIQKRYPDCDISSVSITRLKEENSFVGTPKRKVIVTTAVRGKPRELDITDAVRAACESITEDIVKNIEALIHRCDTDWVEQMLGNIIFTGGGSLIGGLQEFIQARLQEGGYVAARVQKVPDYKRLVARGAYKVSQQVRDDQWQIPV